MLDVSPCHNAQYNANNTALFGDLWPDWRMTYLLQEFLQQLGEKDGVVNKNIIGQFGVGFYSTFMVSDSVNVYTRSCKPDSVGYSWHSDG